MRCEWTDSISYLKDCVCLSEGLQSTESTEDFDLAWRCLCIAAARDLSLRWLGNCRSPCSNGVKLGKFPKLGNPGKESLIPPAWCAPANKDLSSGLSRANPK